MYSDHKQLTTPPLELDLKALEVRFVLNNLDKTSLSTTSLLFGLSIKIKIMYSYSRKLRAHNENQNLGLTIRGFRP